jgi:ABC-2 type transport system permease protein
MMLLFAQLRWELHKLFSRKRTYLGFIGFLVYELLLFSLIQRNDARLLIRPAIERAGYSFAENFTGPTVANFVLSYTLTVLGGFYLALVGGDIVSKEIEDGTMRMVLSHHVSRARVLLLKVIACYIYTVVLCAFIAATSLLLGLAFEGSGNLFVVSADQRTAAAYDFWNGLLVYFFGALPLLTLSMLSVTSAAFMFSCCNVKPAAATVAAISIFVGDQLLSEIPFFVNIRHWFLTTRLISWSHIYARHVPWRQLWINYSTLLALDGLAIAFGCWRFSRRDLKP